LKRTRPATELLSKGKKKTAVQLSSGSFFKKIEKIPSKPNEEVSASTYSETLKFPDKPPASGPTRSAPDRPLYVKLARPCTASRR
jgi:hypothetical protein